MFDPADPTESMQVEEQEGAVALSEPSTYVLHFPDQGTIPGFSFFPSGQLPFPPPRMDLHYSTQNWDHLDANSSGSDSFHQPAEEVITQTSTTAVTIAGATEGRLYPQL